MTNYKLHEDCKILSKRVYPENWEQGSNGWTYKETYSNHRNGFYSEIYTKGDNAILVIRGTERNSGVKEGLKDGGSHFLYRRERMIRFKMLQKNMPQKMLAKRLNLTESYISKLITGERYNKDFERYVIYILDVNYCCL